MTSPLFAQIILAFNRQGEADALRILNEFWADVVACTKTGDVVPPGIAAVKLAITDAYLKAQGENR